MPQLGQPEEGLSAVHLKGGGRIAGVNRCPAGSSGPVGHRTHRALDELGVVYQSRARAGPTAAQTARAAPMTLVRWEQPP